MRRFHIRFYAKLVGSTGQNVLKEKVGILILTWVWSFADEKGPFV